MATLKFEELERLSLHYYRLTKYLEDHLLSDAVVGSLKIGQHLQDNLLGIAFVTPKITLETYPSTHQ